MERIIQIIISRTLVALVRFLIGLVGRRYQRFHGEWLGEIPAFVNAEFNIDEPFKRDLWKFAAGLTTVTADIKRVEPKDQDWKRWRFVGKAIDGNLLGFFWNENPDVLSRGAIYVRPDGLDSGKYEGKYLRWREEIRDVVPIPLSLKRWR